MKVKRHQPGKQDHLDSTWNQEEGGTRQVPA